MPAPQHAEYRDPETSSPQWSAFFFFLDAAVFLSVINCTCAFSAMTSQSVSENVYYDRSKG